MARNPRYDILFEPVKIGPVTAPNRFYQVPHASGMTNSLPRVRAAFRGTKAEGGWGVVCSGYCSIHPSSDDTPLPFARLWNDDDVRSHALATDAIHEHGALAGVELWHGGCAVMNRASRIAPLSPSGISWASTHVGFMSNIHSRAMDKHDIRELISWQAGGARRAREAGYDIVYVYAGMGYLPYEFLLPDYNQRDDEYGGGIENRVRLVRQMIEATKDAVGTDCAVALRISVEELSKRPGTSLETEAHEVVSLLKDVPDLWDVKMDSSPTDCGPSRFAEEGSHEPVVNFVKTLTDAPVVGVGRFTSPDAMVSQVRRGVLDLIGAARPSIADPFLPSKIEQGREDEIRECIGCNICIASWHDCVPIRCTQNPTVGEEWRRGWHPERIAPKGSDARVLIIGAGPAGLECARALGARGYDVTLADEKSEFGGRLLFEAKLPGLSAWMRVRDYRLGQLHNMANVELYKESALTADDALTFGFHHIVTATGGKWTRDLWKEAEVPGDALRHAKVFTPNNIETGVELAGKVAVFDFDFYYMGGVLAEKLARDGCDVTYVTPAGYASAWSIMSNELPLVHRRLRDLGVDIETLRRVTAFDGDMLSLADVYTGERFEHACDNLVIVGLRRPNDELARDLFARRDEWRDHGVMSVTAIGDAHAPGAIAHAVHSGRSYAEGLDQAPNVVPYKLDEPFASIVE
ncbi:MAG: FAD-dependent oxidoreductase [Hyphomicrobiaceae bacterium]